jgi:hypothetical protein
MSLEFSYSYWWILAIIFISSGLSYWLYYIREQKSELKKSVVITLFLIRFVGLFVLLLLLLNPLIKREDVTKQKPIIAIGLDNSASIIQNKDSIALKRSISEKMQLLLSALSERFDIKTYTFGSKTDVGNVLNHKEKQSNPSSFFETVENNYSNQNLVASIVMTDGIVNEGVWPEMATEKLKGNIYAIALGDTTPIKDASIEKVFSNNIAYLGNTFPVEVSIKANDLKDAKSKISIQLNGVSIADKTIDYTTKRFSTIEKFTLPAKQAGIQTYKVVLETIKDEKNIANNITTFTIEVLDAKEKILMLANAPHPDISAIKQSIESNENYSLTYSPVDEFNGQINGYSLVILHQVNQATLAKYLQSNVSVWYIGNTPNLQIADLRSPSSNKQTEIESQYNKGFGLFSISDKSIATISNAPPVLGLIGEYTTSNSFQSLFYQKIGLVGTQNPLLAFSNSNGKKTGVLLGDGLWKWRLYDYQQNQSFEAFNELIRKTIQYLSTKEDKSFFRVNTRKMIKENEALTFDAEVYDNTYTLTTDAEVTLELKSDNSKTYSYTFSKNDNGFNVSAGTFPAGNYSYIATARYKGQTYKKNGTITITALLAETSNLVADHSWLYNVTKQSGGSLYDLNNVQSLIDRLLQQQDYKTINYSQKKLTELINIQWLLGLLIVLFGIEWLIRKRNGLV